FFHTSIKRRLSKQSIAGVACDGTWVENPQDIKEAALSFFKAKFVETLSSRAQFRSSKIKVLPMAMAEMLEQPFSEIEIWEAV
ncbi:hypothetical protein RYX56_24245, partial [Alkalihalophilus lindianensis]